MNLPQAAIDKLKQKGHQFRHALSYIDALPQLSLLGLLVGFFTGIIIIAFRLCIELPAGGPFPYPAENFEALSEVHRVGLVLVGSTLIYMLLRLAGPERSNVSVSHVLERMHNYQGRLPFINWVIQFVGGVLCIIFGHSVGREGPAIHLGAGVASQLGQWLRLPHNSLHTLIACGVAAAIAASFDTPMAGVIFAMEVIVMEYTIVGFVPVILAATVGTAMSHLIFEDAGPIIISSTAMKSLWELPIMAVAGLILAACAALFIRINIEMIKLGNQPLWLRMAGAALIGSVAAWYIPEVMGLSYDTLGEAMVGQIAFSALISIALYKLCVTAAIIGLGIPGGIIGPTLVSGACLGGAIGIVAQLIFPEVNTDPRFYAILGMAGMMAAVINAPLAALVAVLELSYNPNMIFPAMLVIVVACVSTRSIFGFKGIFLEQLKHSGRALSLRPAQQVLRRAGVRSVMDTNFIRAHQQLDYDEVKKLLGSKPQWIVIGEESERVGLRAAHLASWLEERAPAEVLSLEATIDLLAIPAERITLRPMHDGASLWEALKTMREEKISAVYIARTGGPHGLIPQGIVTEEQINNFYLN